MVTFLLAVLRFKNGILRSGFDSQLDGMERPLIGNQAVEGTQQHLQTRPGFRFALDQKSTGSVNAVNFLKLGFQFK
jgi:hypothetical protein